MHVIYHGKIVDYPHPWDQHVEYTWQPMFVTELKVLPRTTPNVELFWPISETSQGLWCRIYHHVTAGEEPCLMIEIGMPGV